MSEPAPHQWGGPGDHAHVEDSTAAPTQLEVAEALDTCLLRTENSGENCPPGHDCAECEHYEREEAGDE